MKFLYLIGLFEIIANVKAYQNFISFKDISKFPIYDNSKLHYCQAGRPSSKKYKPIVRKSLLYL